MKELRKNLVRLLLPLAVSSLLLAILSIVLAQGAEAEPRGASFIPRWRGQPELLDYQTGVSVCEQTRNLVPNPGFEQDIGAPYGKPDHWYENGGCLFSYDDPGHQDGVSAEITGVPRGENCRLLTTIREIPVEPGRFYDYSAWVQADLEQGDAYLRVLFWRWQENPPEWIVVGPFTYTAPVTDTQGAWTKIIGSAQAPATTEYARMELVLPQSSGGWVRFDDIFLGLATCLDIRKSGHPDLVAPGEMLTYTIVYSNTGREKATNVEVVETYDRYVDFESAQPPPDRSNNIWKVDVLTAGTGGTITVVVQVEDDVGGRASLLNCIEVDSEETVKPIYTCITTSLITTDGCDLVVYPPEAAKVVGPGPADYSLSLHNVGGCSGQADLVAASSQSWPLTITPSPSYTMPSRSKADVKVAMHVPQNAINGTVDVTFVTATLKCGSPCSRTAVATATLTTIVGQGVEALTDIDISGPTAGRVNLPHTFTAGISPITATSPFTYHWRVTGQGDVLTVTGALSHTVLFTWSTPGVQAVVVTAANAGSLVTDIHSITIRYEAYLPLVMRRWPPIPDTPVLKAISNSDIDGNYTVSWNAASLAITYTLQEDDNASFSSPTIRYTGPMTSWNANAQVAGVYYYRVKGSNSWGSSGQSNVEKVGAWWESEPNDNGLMQANGPIVCGPTYHGTFTSTTDIKDYFYFTLTITHTVELWLTNIPPGSNYELCLRNASLGEIECSANSGNADEHILVGPLPPGLYRIQVYKRSSTGSTQPYHLRLECR